MHTNFQTVIGTKDSQVSSSQIYTPKSHWGKGEIIHHKPSKKEKKHFQNTNQQVYYIELNSQNEHLN